MIKKGKITWGLAAFVRRLCAIAVIQWMAATVTGQIPAWWVERGVLTNSATTNDYAPANAGQLKHLAWAASDAMEERFAPVGGAGEAVRQLVRTFTHSGNYAALNVGQLKYVASVFYDRLIELGLTNAYPWLPNHSNDYALANVGQLKHVFCFELTLPMADTDADGMPDFWEEQLFGGLQESAAGDFDDDGADNLSEYLAGTDPVAEWIFPHPVINEVLYNVEAEAGFYQFVELYNPYPRALRLHHYTLQVGRHNEMEDVAKLNGCIEAKGYFLAGGAKVVTASGQGADQLILQRHPFLKTLNGGTGPVAVVYLRHDRADGALDGLAYGRPPVGGVTNTFFPGCALPPHEAAAANASIERRQPGCDHDVAEDWITQTKPTPTSGSDAPLFDEADLDRDELPCSQEEAFETDPLNPDTDGDGLTDGNEVNRQTDPRTSDTDGDGLADAEELRWGTNPCRADTDGDGIWDGSEMMLKLDPLVADSDADGIPDGDVDTDGDGFSNAEEQAAGSNLASPSSTVLSWDLPPAWWRYPMRSWIECGDDCSSIVVSGNPEIFDVTYCKRRYAPLGPSCGKAFKQDFTREQAFEFYNVNDSVPAYWLVSFYRYSNNASYSVSGAQCVHSLWISDLQTTLYATQLRAGTGRRVTVFQHAAAKRVCFSRDSTDCFASAIWPAITVQGPKYLNIRVRGLSGALEEDPGLLLFRNSDDDNGNGISDWEDDFVQGGDDDMTYVQLEYPKFDRFRDRVRLEWNRQIIRVHEHSSKKLCNTTGGSFPEGWVFNADVGACIANAPYRGYDDGVVYLEGIRPGVTYFVMKDARVGRLCDQVKVTVVDPRIVPDWNHDRVINEQDETNGIQRMPFRFWINDDDDFGDIAEDDSDVPGQGLYLDRANCHDDRVNGRSDAVDFFPLWLDLHDVLQAWPPNRRTRYVLRHAEQAVRVVLTDLGRQEAGSYLTKDCSVYGRDLQEPMWRARSWLVGGGGFELPAGFLNRVRADREKGVVLVEGTQPTESPLVLEIWRDGELACTRELPLKLSGVEQMYRWLNLREVIGGAVKRPTDMSVPPNYPDHLSNGKHFVFVHGFNVSEEQARGWNAEVFKRLYWAGSRAMYTAVTWFGDETPGVLPFAGVYYHADVINAFQTASNLADAVSVLPGEKYLAAHSLGNMVVSSAIVDHGLNAVKYFMINAAVAMEAYKADERHVNDMVSSTWLVYSNRLWSSEWYMLFPTNDGRHALTWRGRFKDIPQAINYYSSGEDVLDNNDPPEDWIIPLVAKAWVFQERVKGRILPAILVGVDSHGGWGFNSTHYHWVHSPEDTEGITADELRSHSFFKPFYRDDLYGTNGSMVARSDEVRTKLLAEALPATSRAMGRNHLNAWGDLRNQDLMPLKTAGWPRNDKNWLHSDFRKVAFLYVYKFFEHMVEEGGLW